MSSALDIERDEQANATTPLKGDGSGVYRVHIVGNSGTGKSTLSDELGMMLALPVFHLDSLFWNPGWVETPVDEFQAKVTATLASEDCKRGWVIDGNYLTKLSGQLDGVTDIIWLDTPFLLYFPRLVMRTISRLFSGKKQCAPGCNERITDAFSRNGILWWAITNHVPLQRRQSERLRVHGVHVGGRMRRIGGWGNELRDWKLAVWEAVKRK